MRRRKIIVNITTSADGYVAGLDGNLDWLTERPAPKGFYGLPEFELSIDAKIVGRKTIIPLLSELLHLPYHAEIHWSMRSNRRTPCPGWPNLLDSYAARCVPCGSSVQSYSGMISSALTEG